MKIINCVKRGNSLSNYVFPKKKCTVCLYFDKDNCDFVKMMQDIKHDFEIVHNCQDFVLNYSVLIPKSKG